MEVTFTVEREHVRWHALMWSSFENIICHTALKVKVINSLLSF
jgi:hypothetical protein